MLSFNYLTSSKIIFRGSLRAPTPTTASLHLFTATAGHVSVENNTRHMLKILYFCCDLFTG